MFYIRQWNVQLSADSSGEREGNMGEEKDEGARGEHSICSTIVRELKISHIKKNNCWNLKRLVSTNWNFLNDPEALIHRESPATASQEEPTSHMCCFRLVYLGNKNVNVSPLQPNYSVHSYDFKYCIITQAQSPFGKLHTQNVEHIITFSFCVSYNFVLLGKRKWQNENDILDFLCV